MYLSLAVHSKKCDVKRSKTYVALDDVIVVMQ
jgi:hypothetical protein